MKSKIRAIVLLCAIAIAMPSWAQETPGKLVEKSLLDGQITMLLPDNFEPLDSNIVEFKYPGKNRPVMVYSNVEITVNVTFSVKENSNRGKISMALFTNIMAQTLEELVDGTKILDQGVIRQGGGDYGYVELKTKATGMPVYNLMYFAITDKDLIIVSFNCPTKQLKTWKTVAQQMMASLVVKGA